MKPRVLEGKSNEKNNIFVLCFDDCTDAGIGKRRHGVRFRTASLMKQRRPSSTDG